MLYLIFWPLLAIAAAAMDNSLVYGGAFHLTNVLFQFWQIVRTFANYTIGLYFVGSILAAFFWNKLENVFSGLIKNVAIAAILVNFSRWMMAALIDLSTLMTFSLWALPLHALGDDQVFKENVYYMKTFNNLNLNASTAKNADKFDFSIMYGCTQGEWAEATTKYYLPCAIDDRKLFLQWSASEPLRRAQYKEDFIKVRQNDTKINTADIQDAYCVYQKQLIKNEYGANIHECKVLQRLMAEGRQEWIAQCASVDKIVTKAMNNSWPLLTMFSSILNMSELWLTTNSWSVKEVALNLLIKLIFWFALIIPLITFAVVMVIRVVYLWLIIAFSPLITIAVALQRGDKIWSKIEWVLSNVLKPAQIVSLVFLPVIATFWLSISIIFLSLLKNLPLIENKVGRSETAFEQPDGCYNDIASALGMDRDQTKEWKEYDFGVTKLNFSESLRETGADIGNVMSWLIINFFGIALMRMVVFATLKTNEFTKWVAETIESTAKQFLGTVPIIPIGWGIWTTTAGKIPDLIKQKYVDTKLRDQENMLEEVSASYDPSTQEVKKNLIAAQTDPSKIGGLNETQIPQNTDFLSDYQAWAKAYAQKAKSYFYDANNNLTPAGQTYSSATGKNQSQIKSSLDAIDNWNNGLANPEFVHWMHTEDGGKGYDNFIEHRDTRERKAQDPKTAKVLEEWLKDLSGPNNYNRTMLGSTSVHWYLYDNDTKLTLFKRNKNDTHFTGEKPTTYKINNQLTDADISNLTDEDMSWFNQMLLLDKTRFSTLPFYQLLESKSSSAEITIANNKKYKPTIDNGTFKWFEPVSAATPPPTTPTRNP